MLATRCCTQDDFEAHKYQLLMRFLQFTLEAAKREALTGNKKKKKKPKHQQTTARSSKQSNHCQGEDENSYNRIDEEMDDITAAVVVPATTSGGCGDSTSGALVSKRQLSLEDLVIAESMQQCSLQVCAGWRTNCKL